MKKYLTFVILIANLSVFAQVDRFYFEFGYGIASKSYSSAYSDFYTKPASGSIDLGGLSYQKDKMRYSNWHFHTGILTEDVYWDQDGSFILVGLPTVIVQGLPQNNREKKPNNMIGVGKLRKVDENIDASAVAYGTDYPIYLSDLAVGSDGWYIGAYFGVSMLGINTDGIEGNSYGRGQNTGILVPEETLITGHFGAGVHRAIGDESTTILSMRVNRLVRRKAYSGENIKRKGLELMPSVRMFFGEDAGFYGDITYKFQRFKSGSYSSEELDDEIIRPEWKSSGLSLKLGFFITRG